MDNVVEGGWSGRRRQEVPSIRRAVHPCNPGYPQVGFLLPRRLIYLSKPCRRLIHKSYWPPLHCHRLRSVDSRVQRVPEVNISNLASHGSTFFIEEKRDLLKKKVFNFNTCGRALALCKNIVMKLNYFIVSAYTVITHRINLITHRVLLIF